MMGSLRALNTCLCLSTDASIARLGALQAGMVEACKYDPIAHAAAKRMVGRCARPSRSCATQSMAEGEAATGKGERV